MSFSHPFVSRILELTSVQPQHRFKRTKHVGQFDAKALWEEFLLHIHQPRTYLYANSWRDSELGAFELNQLWQAFQP
jgi:hypothetical protein